ncbi:MAG: hypothetical protein JXB85_13490 [Anaerolineales bacterium]|nr:hypothetical protein [Anaerolineales bacterium]
MKTTEDLPERSTRLPGVTDRQIPGRGAPRQAQGQAGEKRTSALRALILAGWLLVMTACTASSATAFTPTPTSLVAHREDESLVHAGAFRLTVTLVSHLSNAVMLTIEVENISGSTAAWTPGEAVPLAYVLDGGERSSILQASGIFDVDLRFDAMEKNTGQLIFPLPRGETFEFHYPDCAPAFVTLHAP